MKKYSKLKTALAVAIMSFSMINTVIAADAPIELKGDVIECADRYGNSYRWRNYYS